MAKTNLICDNGGKAKKCGFSDEEWDAFLMYVSRFYYNNGNYRGFGDSKIIPGVDIKKIDALTRASEAAKVSSSFLRTWDIVQPVMGTLESKQLHLGYGDRGVTCYHSENIDEADAERIDRFSKAKELELWNSRLFKNFQKRDGKTVYRLRLASSKIGTLEVIRLMFPIAD
ncbi:unnamed protein product [Cylicostephanus goldi]|uniref:Uncharacterized protein n=1 Tax=Cylicostephanus goldi TaxID=71465 RepID=A0A3P7PZ12_CYLGO|nr:unnamed protein product [Cylicostephanus goldi]